MSRVFCSPLALRPGGEQLERRLALRLGHLLEADACAGRAMDVVPPAPFEIVHAKRGGAALIGDRASRKPRAASMTGRVETPGRAHGEQAGLNRAVGSEPLERVGRRILAAGLRLQRQCGHGHCDDRAQDEKAAMHARRLPQVQQGWKRLPKAQADSARPGRYTRATRNPHSSLGAEEMNRSRALLTIVPWCAVRRGRRRPVADTAADIACTVTGSRGSGPGAWRRARRTGSRVAADRIGWTRDLSRPGAQRHDGDGRR